MPHRGSIGMLALGLVLRCTFAAAQTDVLETNAGVQFDFINPGARSLALGGAFVGLADDATAALTNPAGLTFLSKKEFSIEGRFRQFVTPYVSGGRVSGIPTGIGLDVTPVLQISESRQSATSLSFLSFVYPANRWAVAAYRQQLTDFRASQESQGPLVGVSGRFPPYRSTLSLDIVRYGVSGAAKLGDHASIGVGFTVYEFDITAEILRFDRPTQFAPSNFSSLFNRQTETGAQRRTGVNIGFTATPTTHLQIGGVYRKGARFNIAIGQSLQSSAAIARLTPGVFSVPDVYGFGIVLRPANQLKLMVDYDWVRYSSMTGGFVVLSIPAPTETPPRPSDFKIDDAHEVHAGLEYVLLRLANPIAIRAGAWYDPDHALRFQPDTPQNASTFDSTFFRKGTNVVHVTGGAGLSFRAFELNLAGDYSSRGSILSVSSVVRF